MVEYTNPITTAFELQRKSLERSQEAVQQSVRAQQNVADAVVESIDTQQSAQRRAAELGQSSFHSYLDTVESSVPGVGPTVEEIRQTVDEQYEFLLDNHAEVFETVEDELAEGTETYDELSEDVLVAIEEQVDLLLQANEELESQSVEAVEQWGDQLEDLQDQVEEVQEQVQEVQEQAADAVEA